MVVKKKKTRKNSTKKPKKRYYPSDAPKGPKEGSFSNKNIINDKVYYVEEGAIYGDLRVMSRASNNYYLCDCLKCKQRGLYSSLDIVKGVKCDSVDISGLSQKESVKKIIAERRKAGVDFNVVKSLAAMKLSYDDLRVRATKDFASKYLWYVLIYVYRSAAVENLSLKAFCKAKGISFSIITKSKKNILRVNSAMYLNHLIEKIGRPYNLKELDFYYRIFMQPGNTLVASPGKFKPRSVGEEHPWLLTPYSEEPLPVSSSESDEQQENE